jgi:hypothetical protein
MILNYIKMINKGDKFDEIYIDIQDGIYDCSIQKIILLESPQDILIRNTLYQTNISKRITNEKTIAYNMWLIQKDKCIKLEITHFKNPLKYYFYYIYDHWYYILTKFLRF